MVVGPVTNPGACKYASGGSGRFRIRAPGYSSSSGTLIGGTRFKSATATVSSWSWSLTTATHPLSPSSTSSPPPVRVLWVLLEEPRARPVSGLGRAGGCSYTQLWQRVQRNADSCSATSRTDFRESFVQWGTDRPDRAGTLWPKRIRGRAWKNSGGGASGRL